MTPTEPISFRRIADDMEAGTWNLSCVLPYLAQKDSGSREWELEWEHQEAKNRPAIDLLATQWATAGWSPTEHEEQQYWLRLRLVAASRFLYQCSLSDDRSIFEIKRLSKEDIIACMLTKWWADVGRSEAMFHIIDRPKSSNFPLN